MRHRQSEYTFSQVPRADIPRSNFRRSHGHKTTFDSGYLVPVYIDEVLPGDTFNVKSHIFARLSTPVVPIMDNIYLDVFFFAVPNRLIWSNWQKFCGEQLNPGDSTDYLVPQITGPFTSGTVHDYMGLPLGVNVNACAFWARAYNLIYNEWFRDENLQTRAIENKGDGPDAPGDYPLRKRGKRHDYFTSCLPWPQKGPGVNLPIGGTAPVSITPTDETLYGRSAPTFRIYGDATESPIGTKYNSVDDTSDVKYRRLLTAGQTDLTLAWGAPGLKGVADLSSASAATINSLRQAFQLQRMQERDARGGTRYREILQSHFNVTSPDARLQRPEYLGGGTVPVNINPVAQTSATSAGSTPIGKLAGFGTAGGSGIGFTKSFVEHCVIVGMIMARCDLSYQQGLPRMFSRRTRYDFYWPALAHLGEQAVLNKEIYAQGIAADDAVFGYQERWSEYRYYPSKITGKFRSTDPQPLDYWHLAQKFTALPALNSTFIEEAPPIARVLAVQTEPQFILDSFFEIQTARPMPVYSVPGMIDHF